jgi:hypothetical protein
MFSLGSYFKQAGDELHLTQNISFFHATHLLFLTMFMTSYPCSVRHAVSNEKKPSPGLTRRL